MNKYLVFAGLLLSLAALAQAQEGLRELSDRAFIDYVREFRNPTGISPSRPESDEPKSKCGLRVSAEIARRMPTLSAADQNELRKLTAPVPQQTSISSASGRFIIHFDTTGPNVPALLVNDSGAPIPNTGLEYAIRIGEYFDRSYDVEVLQEGYEAPPSPPYHIYIKNMGTIYGATFTSQQVPKGTLHPCWTTYIEIDNDFSGYYTEGLRGAQVTAAHEFHHMVQIGSYGFGDELYVYEMTSTYFEDFVFPDVNDYRQYLKAFFTTPERSLYRWPGYELVLFPKFLEKRFGTEALRKCWDEIKQAKPMTAINNALRTFQSEFAQEYCLFTEWNYFTGYHAAERAANERYDDAPVYPSVKFYSEAELINNDALFSSGVSPFAAQYFKAYKHPDTVTFSVANTDLASAINPLQQNKKRTFSLDVNRQNKGAGYLPLKNGWFYKFTSDGSAHLCATAFSRDAIADGPLLPFPNPFRPEQDFIVRLPVPSSNPNSRGNIHIFSASMNQVFKDEEVPVHRESSYGSYFTWNGLIDESSTAPTGVYFYIISFGSEEYHGKFALIRTMP